MIKVNETREWSPRAAVRHRREARRVFSRERKHQQRPLAQSASLDFILHPSSLSLAAERPPFAASVG